MKRRSKLRIVLLTFSIAFILFGAWFSSTNAFKFIKGYLIFKSGQIEAKEIHKKPVEQEPDESKEILYLNRPTKGENIGKLIIPKLDASLPIFHGTDEEELEKGVGHYAQSVLPGEEDNSVLSGHRDTVFRKLGEVGKGDLLIVETSTGTFTYRVKNVRIVDKDDRTVIVPKPRATLTVSTCYPFDFIGASPERYILVANLISKKLT
ncbi:class D sortase [Fictibacillus barbaricus]|uniref:Class D sortase n=1 Tax=Fictibacillus barbaricus TaxID=182136 RepID=A0ABS2ZDW4_9BACL|nr:class D sortase [Fictibacillus barbaricus]MBN3545544.1 class D sortase [Fictibacillus barbaricus]GGB54235.1 sortase [Fictibacillus barbaricus]